MNTTIDMSFVILGKADGLESNWIPTAGADFFLLFRFYGPEEAALKGDWVNPPMIKIN
jgi:hypothetical protein